jgi:hypothetical protein
MALAAVASGAFVVGVVVVVVVDEPLAGRISMALTRGELAGPLVN